MDRSPRLTAVSEQNPLRRLLMTSKPILFIESVYLVCHIVLHGVSPFVSRDFARHVIEREDECIRKTLQVSHYFRFLHDPSPPTIEHGLHRACS